MSLALKVKNLSVQFSGFSVLQGVNFEIPPCAFLSVLGPNGAGKTVFAKTLLGLIIPSSGEILIGDQPLISQRHLIGYVPQVKTLDRSFPATGQELVASGLHQKWPWKMSVSDKTLVDQALKQVQAQSFATQQLSQLSGGQLQRLFLARALIKKPKFIVLDEPSTGIDFVGESDLYTLLEHYRQQTHATIVMITHDREVAHHHSTHCLLLNQCQLAFGSPREALTDSHLQKAFGHQHSHGEITMKEHQHD